MALTKVTYSMIDGAVVNVLDYGADPTGVADSTVAAATALATGKSVYWPEGTYKVSPIAPGRPHSEPNRTSAWELKDGQTVFGDGPNSKLVWGTPGTRQCFFKAADCVNVTLKNLTFDGGYSAIIVDPAADGSVDGVTIENCVFKNMLIDVLGGNQFPIDATSKYGKNIMVRGCYAYGPAVHSILFTNCYNAQAIGNTFNNVSGGYCIDASQGSRNVVLSDNTADTCLYFCKVESTDVAGIDPTQWASQEVIIANNTAINVNLYGIFVNTVADNIVISNNVMKGFSNHGIFLDQVVAFSYTGAITVANNVLTGKTSATNAFGISDNLSNGTLPHVLSGNVIDEVENGIQINRKNAVITGGSINANANCIVIASGGGPDGIIISGVKMNGESGVNGNGTALPFKRMTVTGCDITFTAAGVITAAATSQCIFNNNTLNSDDPTLGGVILTTPLNCSIQNNTINIDSSTVAAITNTTSATNCIVAGNITTRPITLVGATPGTINTGNITNAAYVS